MSKKKLNAEAIMNELNGSVFFPAREQEEEPRVEEKPASQPAVLPAIQQDGLTESQNASNTANQQDGKPTEKVTFRFHKDGVDAIEDIKRMLRRNHNIKTSFAEIAEEAIKIVYEDLLANQHDSKLAKRLSEKP